MDEPTATRWLELLSSPAIGPGTLRGLLDRFGSAAAVAAASPRDLRAAGLDHPQLEGLERVDRAAVARGLGWLAAPGHAMITADDEAFPPLLGQLPQAPAVLFVDGDPGALWLPQLAIVGSRSATRGGLDNARRFARALARAGLTVTSGLALGIDGAAHRGALDAGALTVAVVASGLDRVYPARHRALAAEIREQGAIVSEFLPGTPPKREHFPQRNRIISGLSTGVLVVEASVKSGSLITARRALEQDREVFAIPGSIHNPVARGCHQLIKAGAKLVETAEDVLAELGPSVLAQVAEGRRRLGTHVEEAARPGLDPEYRRLLDLMGFDPVSVDMLVESSGLTVEVVSSMLLILELDGRVEAGPGGSYCRIGEEHP